MEPAARGITHALPTTSWRCRLQLLADPATQARLAGLAAAADLLALPGALLLAIVTPDQTPLANAGTPSPAAVCQAALLFLQLAAGVVAPLLLSVYRWYPYGASGSSEGSSDAVAMPRIAFLQHQAAPHIVFTRELALGAAGSCKRAAAAADSAVRALCWSGSGAAAQTLVAWWLTSLCWLLSKQVAGLPLI